jgi:uncharacterized protein YecE (DUF72 family)
MTLFPELEPATKPERGVLVGTSGYSFADWVGAYYPAGMRPSEFLGYYAREFPAVEVNSTHYGVPKPRTMERMENKTPHGFHFVVKLHQSVTHTRDFDAGHAHEFLAAVAPLRAAGKLDGFLAQFPWAFHRNQVNERYLARVRGAFPRDPLWVEFRHDSWAGGDVPGLLRATGLGYCMVDEPALPGLMPPTVALTSEDAYVRFHGRNAHNWWSSASAGDRYDYLYSPVELREWIDKVRALAEQARRTYLFFNNCHAGQAARNARLMSELLRQQRLA